MRKILLILLLILPACSAPQEARSTSIKAAIHPWAAALRALDPADAANPALDLTALYLREEADALQIRVDLLDFQSATDLSLDISLVDETVPGLEVLAIHIPPESDTPGITIDPTLDTVTVLIPRTTLPDSFHVDVTTPEDELSGFRPDDSPVTLSVPLLLTLYGSFAGRFPAEALRSWDGAHSGPRGERHGLRHLLTAVADSHVPVALLDLSAPENLSALDAMGQLPELRRLAQSGLLLLPKTSGEEPGFGLPPSDICYSAAGDALEECVFSFQFLADANHVYRSNQFPFRGQTTIPIASEKTLYQPTAAGPSLEVRRVLLEIALNEDPMNLLVLGGSLPQSNWGDPDMVGPTLAYFAERPYIHPLTEADLLVFPAIAGVPELLPTPIDDKAGTLESHYDDLTGPVLVTVADWEGASLASCDRDLDQDGQPECLLANDKLLAVLDPHGARLTYLFTRDEAGLHQLIGPSWQVATGLSDAFLWRLDLGEAADPGAIPGAFAEPDDPFRTYELTIEGDTLVFRSGEGGRTKAFRLADSGLEVEYQPDGPLTTRIPLLVDPWKRFTPGWASEYVGEKTPNGVVWGLEGGPTISLQADAPVQLQAFNDSAPWMDDPEDPDFDYPPGHYLPYPMGVVEAQLEGNAYFLLEFR